MKNNNEYAQAVAREIDGLKKKFTRGQLAFADWVNVYDEAKSGEFPACEALLGAEGRLYEIDPGAFADEDLRRGLGLPGGGEKPPRAV